MLVHGVGMISVMQHHAQQAPELGNKCAQDAAAVHLRQSLIDAIFPFEERGPGCGPALHQAGLLDDRFERLVPEDADYFAHNAEGSDDMPSHIRMVLTRTSETVPIADGQMQLGTWQGIFLFEHRRASHRRNLLLTIIGE